MCDRLGLLCIAVIGPMSLLGGCASEGLDYTEVKRVEEALTAAEVAQFVRIVARLPKGRLPEISPLLAATPEWNPERTVTVSKLVGEEQKRLIDTSAPELFVEQLAASRELERALRKERMTLQQFVGLTLTIGFAVSRSHLRDGQDLSEIIRRGTSVVHRLQGLDDENFSSLSPERRYHILREAMWIARVARAKSLDRVPTRNVEIVRSFAEKLHPTLPVELVENPLDPVADLLEERGIPFDEVDGAERDDEIEWDPQTAIVGTDPPDEEIADRSSLRSPFRRESEGGSE